jgi:hypothetical protein
LRRIGLTSYCGSVQDVVVKLGPASRGPFPDAIRHGVTVRPLDLHAWERELETFRSLCDATLGATRFYAPTRPGHFTDLLNDLKPFLRPENLLFATIGGREVGFCFWHPDFNEILPTGRRVSMPGIAWRFALRRSGIRTVILNALGVLPDYRGVATAALLGRMSHEVEGGFNRYETSFVWDGNYASIGVGRYLDSRELRQYAVWVEDLGLRSG